MTSYLASVQAQQGSENKIEKKILVPKWVIQKIIFNQA
jgi:hypothetical protein